MLSAKLSLTVRRLQVLLDTFLGRPPFPGKFLRTPKQCDSIALAQNSFIDESPVIGAQR